jgi:hypothetical protein
MTDLLVAFLAGACVGGYAGFRMAAVKFKVDRARRSWKRRL